MVDKIAIAKVLGLSEKQYLEIVKCGPSVATRMGEGAMITMAVPTDDRENFTPKRHLQDMGFDDNGEHLGYIGSIEYPSGFIIDYVGGTITDNEGNIHQMGYDDNYFINGSGNVQHNPKGTANELFKYQRQEFLQNPTVRNRKDYQMTMKMATYLKSGNLTEQMNQIVRDCKGDQRQINAVAQQFMGTPLGYMLTNFSDFNNMIVSGMPTVDRANIAVGTQVERVNESWKKTTSDYGLDHTSVGFLNDKTLTARDTMSGETRSVNGKNNNWNNTWKVYTLITQGDGTKGMYLGYPQNERVGAWDNSGNPHNELDFASGQKFEKMLVDKTNKIIIRRPVND